MPVRLHLAVDEIRTARGERFRLAEGPYVRVPQPGDERGEDPGRGEAVAESIVPRLDGDAEPVRERFEAEIDKPSIEYTREVCDVEHRWIAPGHAGARRLVAKHCEVETNVLADDDTARERLHERLQ